MEYLVIAICSVITSLICSIIYRHKRAMGTLQIDNSNPEQPVWRIDLGKDIYKLDKKKQILLTIDRNADLSQK